MTFDMLVIASLHLGDFLASVDIKDTYLHMPFSLVHQCHLCLVVGKQHYQFVALLFDLPPLPQVYTKVLAPAFALLCYQGISIVHHLDDLRRRLY